MRWLQVPVSLVFVFGLFLSGCGGESPAPTNTDPVAVNDTAAVTQGGAATTINVLANDTDADGDTLTIKTGSATTPNHGGTAVIADNKITYTPPTNYSGTETFQYTVSDGNGGEANATVTVTIQTVAPTASDDTANAKRGGAAVVINVLDNDTDANGDTLTIKTGSVTAPDHGGTAVIADNKITYTPPANYSGVETFTYTASDGQGGEDTATVTVTVDRTWETAELVEHNNSGHTDDPQIAFDGNGNALAVWAQSDGTRDNIWANRYTAGSGWGTEELIENNNSGGAHHPEIAINEDGNAMAVWYQYDGTRNNIWANHYIAGNGWEASGLIENNNSGLAVNPQVAIDGNGNALAVWYQNDGTRLNIQANRYTAGNNWGAAELIETDNNGSTYDPQIAIDGNGNALAVWSQHDGTRYNIWANRYTVGGGWGTAELIETDNNGDARKPQIAIDGDGNALAVWAQSDGTRYNIWANRYTVAGGWGTAELIETNNSGNARNPQIAADGDGNALAVWAQSDGTRYNIWANRYTAGTGWETAELIETNNIGDARKPQIAIDGNGKALAVWSQHDGNKLSIWSNRFW